MQSTISLKGLTKSFVSSSDAEDAQPAVDGVDLDVREREFLVMVGPSGCGKSTILRMIAGLETPTAGEIRLDGRRVDHLPARARNVGFMFQGYALFRHMTVAENIGFGLKIKKVSKKERRQGIEQLVSLMGLDGLEGRKPDQLSGGQQQRVALARALAPNPMVLLLDEPFGAVDAKVRQKLRADTKRWQGELKIPTILVTHDQREALELGDRVAVMNQGRFEQIDTPQNVYDHPATEFVGRFIGRANVFRTTLGSGGNGLGTDARWEVMIRPEDTSITPWENGNQPKGGGLSGSIASYAFLGRTVRLEIRLKSGKLITVALPKQEAIAKGLSMGKSVSLSVDSCQVFPQYPHPRNGSSSSSRSPGADEERSSQTQVNESSHGEYA